MMPRFFKDMPPAKGGKWVAVVQRTNPFRPPTEVWASELRGLRRAYINARLMALLVDLGTPSCDGEIGVNWAIRKACVEIIISMAELCTKE